MREPVAAVADGDAVAGAPGDASEGERVPRGVLAHELLLQGPPRLDRIVVGRIRRQVHETNAVAFTEWPHARIVMRLRLSITKTSPLCSFGSRPDDTHATKRSPFADAKAEFRTTQPDRRIAP